MTEHEHSSSGIANPGELPRLPSGLIDGGPTPAGPSLRELATESSADEVREAGLPGTSIRVVLDDGRDFTVRTVNADYIRWDKTPPARRGGVKSFTDAPFVFQTFLAWSAARRAELVAGTFDAFLEAALVIERQGDHEVPPTQ